MNVQNLTQWAAVEYDNEIAFVVQMNQQGGKL